MFGEDSARPPVVLQPPNPSDGWGSDSYGGEKFDIDGSSARNRFREFFRNFRLDNVYLYRDSLIRQYNAGLMFVEVDLSHLNQYDAVLYNSLTVSHDFRSPST